MSPAALLSVLDEEINQENRPDPGSGDHRAAGHDDSEYDGGGDRPGDEPAVEPYKRTIIR